MAEEFVNDVTGECSTPAEWHRELRALERDIERLDSAIAIFKIDLSTAKKEREKKVAAFRQAVRDVRHRAEQMKKRRPKGGAK